MFRNLRAKINLLRIQAKSAPVLKTGVLIKPVCCACGWDLIRAAMEVVTMTSKRVFILVAACILLLGVPGWQAQNSPAQDRLPQVDERQIQQPPAQEPQAQEPPAQEVAPQELQPETAQPQQPAVQEAPAPTVQESAPQEFTAPERNEQAEETNIGTPEEAQEAVAQRHHRRAGDAEKAESKQDANRPVAKDALTNPVLWHEPGDIASKDLFWGHGGQQHRPRPPFTFVREDLQGSSPKFDCRDANGKKWRVKLGVEARPEVTASRLLWAVGYFVNDDYVLPRAEIRGLKMHRHSSQQRGTAVIDARFARKPGGLERIGTWRWRDNPFFGTREFNGLRVMMAVINNWDLKDSNNAVQEARDHQQQVFLVSDVGASFGANAIDVPTSSSKGNPHRYEHSKFITRSDGVMADFATPAAPAGMLVKAPLVGAIAYARRSELDWIGHNIPVPDAHWMGTLLGQLSHQQLVDAFRAGNFPPDQIERYVSVLEDRIRELQGI